MVTRKKVLINVTNTLPVQRGGCAFISGIGQCTKALVSEIDKIENLPIDIELYATSYKARSFDFYGWKLKHHILPIPSKFKFHNRQIESYLRPVLFDYNLFHITENYFDVSKKENFVVTIHDCTDMDETYSSDISIEFRKSLVKRYQLMSDRSASIITDSFFSKEEIIKYFNVPSEKVNVVHLGIDTKRFRILAADSVKTVLDRYDIHNPYFFACSCNRPRKNLITALRAYKFFLQSKPEHIFVVAWNNPPSYITSEFEEEIRMNKILFLPFLDDEDLVALYNGATASFYVSLKEGFGMPILESFSCGTPVVTCDNSSLPEVGKDAAIYVGEYDIDGMTDIMKMFEKDSFLYDEFRTSSKKVLDSFNWRNTAEKYIDIYKSNL